MSRIFSPEDLISFAEDLRPAGYNIGTQQCVAAQQLLVTLAAHARLPADPRELKTWLAPVLCSSAKEQEVFYDLFERWLEQHGFGTPAAPPHAPLETQAPGLSPAARLLKAFHPLRRPRLLLIAAAVVAVAFVLVGLLLLNGPRSLAGKVVDERGQPVQDALIGFGRRTTRSDGSGQFSLALSSSILPNTLTVKHPNYVGASRRLETIPEGLVTVTLRRPTLKQQSNNRQVFTVPDSIIEFQPTPAARRWPSWLILLSPLLVLAAWLLWRARRRMSLEKMQSGRRPLLERIFLRNTTALLFRGASYRRALQELRRHRRREAPEVDSHQTVQSTAARGGLYTPVAGTRTVSPEYLVLIDRASFHDQQARLEDEVVRCLKDESVFVDRYYFSGDPRLCHNEFQTKRPLRLSDLAALHHDHHLLIFSDGASFINPFTGRPEPWVEMLSAWRGRALLTPERRPHWGYCEATLLDQGLFVLPLSQEGLAELAETINADSLPASRRAAEHAPPYPELLRQNPRRWLERHKPRPEIIRRLCEQLRAYLGDDGYAWLGACAIYPLPQWELTLYLGYSLFGARDGLEEKLVALVRLPWFRRSSMPDWLRLALIADLSQPRERAVRQALRELLVSLVERPTDGIALDFSRREVSQRIGTSALADSLRTWARRFKYESLLHALFRAESPDGPLRDYVFLSFMSGRRPGRLAIGVPYTLRRLLFPHGHSALGLRPAAACALVALLALSGWYWVTSRDIPQPTPSGDAQTVPPVEVLFVSREFKWLLSSSTRIAADEQYPVSGGYEVSYYINALEPLLSDVDVVVCVGLASSDGGPTQLNEELAYRRMRALVDGVRGLNLKGRIYGLNLGFYKGERLSGYESDQRRVIIIGIRNARQNVDVEAMLRNTFSADPFSALEVERYSQFTLTDYTTGGNATE